MKSVSSLHVRLWVWFGLGMGAVCALLIGYFARATRAEALDKARTLLLASARQEAGQIESQLNRAMDAARVLAQSLGTLTEQPGGVTRPDANALMRRVLEQEPDFLDVYTLWEPQAFDGADARYAGTPGHDRTGRFIPVWNRGRDGSIQCEPAVLYETPGPGDYYLLPRRLGRECLLEPFEYPLRGQPVFMTSLVVPVLRRGRFVGITGVDYRLDYLQHLADQVRLYQGACRLTILSQGGVVAGASGRAETVGRRQDPGSALPLPAPGAVEGVFTAGASLFAFTTIRVGQAAERWTVMLTVPTRVTTAAADRRIALLVGGASGFCLLGLLVLLLLIRRNVVGNLRQLTRAAQEESDARYRRIIEDSPIGVFRVRQGGPFDYANRATLQQFECATLEELNARHGTPAGRWSSAGQYAEYRKTLDATGKVMGQEVTVRLPDGKTKFHNLYVFLEREQGVINGFLVDVTEKKLMADRLAQAQKMEAIGHLAGGVAHDFNNALAGILGAAEVLRNDPAMDRNQGKLIDLIITATERAGRLTQKLLAFSRKAPKASSPVDVAAIVKDVSEILARTLDKAITIRVDNRAANTWVVGDDALLQNAFLNLGINAGHAMPDGGVLALRLLDRTLAPGSAGPSPLGLEPGDYLEIQVSDTGIGMGPEVQAHLFEPFFTTKGPGQGTGLGLSAVYGSVQDHHGAITVESEPGVGTLFRILLPLAAQDQVPQATQARVEPGTGTLLLIDDEEIIQVSGKAMLERLGYTVLTAPNGQAGLERLAAMEGRIDLVILDMIMPLMGGRETLQRIRERDRTIPVIMCSGFSREKDLVNLEAYGIAGFLHKPFGYVELAQAVARALRPAGGAGADSGRRPAAGPSGG